MKLIPAIAVSTALTLLPAPVEERDKLLARAKMLTRINETSQRTAVEIGTLLRRLRSDAEKARVEVKAPALQACTTIDGLARQFNDPISAEITRIEKLLTDFAREQRAKQAEAEKKAREEQAKREAEARREADSKIAAVQQSAAADPNPVRAQQTMDFAALQAKKSVAAATAAVPIPAPKPAPSGLTVKESWTFEVTDKTLQTLALHDWTLVRVELNLSAIRERINAGAREIPGLRIFEDVSARTSAR